MTGRKRKLLVLRLIRYKTRFDLIVTRKGGPSYSRLDKIGTIALRDDQPQHYSFCRIDFKKLYKYLISRRFSIATSVAKIWGLEKIHEN